MMYFAFIFTCLRLNPPWKVCNPFMEPIYATYLITYLSLKSPCEVYGCIPMDPTISSPHQKKVVSYRNNKKCCKTVMLELPSTRQSYTPSNFIFFKTTTNNLECQKYKKINIILPLDSTLMQVIPRNISSLHHLKLFLFIVIALHVAITIV